MENNNNLLITQSKFTQNSNYTIPALGIGSSGIKDQDTMNIVIQSAYDCGYRLIDTASVYDNEKLIGNVLKNKENNINREEIFITTKIPSVDEETAKQLLEKSLENLQVDYIDLVLLHWPGFKSVEERIAVWKILEDYSKKGKIKSIGVSNFRPNHLKTILENCKIPPAVNQIELHPLYIDYETIEYCKTNNIVVQAYSPFAKWNQRLIDNPVLIDLCEKYKKSSSQILVRWGLQHGYSVIPKSCKKERIKENIAIDDFALEDNEIVDLDRLNCDYKIISKWDPRTVDF